ncbi:MAG: hypothetical protein ACYDH6_04940 [Acidimicrobiales bacterium]
MRLRLLRAGAVALVVAGSATACEKVNSVASSVSPCFRVLPQAHAAVGGQGTFVDVARVRRGAMPRIGALGPVRLGGGARTSPPSPTPTVVPAIREVCLVAYKGTFDPTRITGLIGPHRSGRYAVVVCGITSRRVRAVVLLDQLPRPLHGR